MSLSVYFSYMEENPMAGVVDDSSDVEVEYDEDGNPIAPPRKREIDPLPPIDHDDITYKPFEKNFYVPHEEINNLSRSQVEELRSHLKIRVSGPLPPRPVASFAHFGFDERLMKVHLQINIYRYIIGPVRSGRSHCVVHKIY